MAVLVLYNFEMHPFVLISCFLYVVLSLCVSIQLSPLFFVFGLVVLLALFLQVLHLLHSLLLPHVIRLVLPTKQTAPFLQLHHYFLLQYHAHHLLHFLILSGEVHAVCLSLFWQIFIMFDAGNHSWC